MAKLLIYDQLYIVYSKKMTSTTFAIGEKFSTFTEVEAKIQLVQRKNYVTLHDGKHFAVTKLNPTHANHDITKDSHKYYPKFRTLNNQQREYAKDMMSMGVNKINSNNNRQLKRGKLL